MKAFLDTNILVYAFSRDHRAERALALLKGNVVGVQSLNEFTNVLLNKLRLDWDEVLFALDRIERLCLVESVIDYEMHRDALAVARRYRLSIFNSMIIAAALRADCDTLWSEDMQDGLAVDGRLTIRNPFA